MGVWTEVKAERKLIMQADKESEQIQRAEQNCSLNFRHYRREKLAFKPCKNL